MLCTDQIGESYSQGMTRRATPARAYAMSVIALDGHYMGESYLMREARRPVPRPGALHGLGGCYISFLWDKKNAHSIFHLQKIRIYGSWLFYAIQYSDVSSNFFANLLFPLVAHMLCIIRNCVNSLLKCQILAVDQKVAFGCSSLQRPNMEWKHWSTWHNTCVCPFKLCKHAYFHPTRIHIHCGVKSRGTAVWKT